MISGVYNKVIFGVSVALIAMGTSHAFEHALFAHNGKFSCLTIEKCHIPGSEEIEWIKNEFRNRSLDRLQVINRYENKANKDLENILWKSQQSELEKGENNFSNFYKNVGSFMDKKLGSMKIDTARVLVSEGSPFIMELEDLQGVLSGAITQRDQGNIGAEEKYYNWYNRSSFQQLLEEMNDLKKRFFTKRSFGLSDSEKLELFPFQFKTCPRKLKRLVSKHFFSADLEKESDFYQRILGHDQKLLSVKCSPSKSRSKLNSSYLGATREIVLPYKVGKRRSVSPVSGMFDKIK